MVPHFQGYFLVKDLFFSIGKKGRALFLQKMLGRGAIRWVCPDTKTIDQLF